jgi:transcriptional regulator with XRE-family HTH domain
MTDNMLNNRERRARAFREILGDNKYEGRRIGLDTADAVREAARFIRQMREYARLTQAQLAQRLDVSQARVSEMERGTSPEGVGYALLRRVAVSCGFPNWPMAPVESLQAERTHMPRVMVEVLPSKKNKRDEVIESAVKVVGRREYGGGKTYGIRKPLSVNLHEFKVIVETVRDRPRGKSTERDDLQLIRKALDESPMLKVIE